MTRFALLALPICLLTACTTAPVPATAPEAAAPTEADLQLRGRLAGKTLSNAESTMALTADGRLLGKESTGEITRGTWEIRDGKWCRTLTEPAAWAGTGCRGVTFSGNTVTMSKDDGTSFTYTISG